MNRRQLKVYPFFSEFKSLNWFHSVGQPLESDPSISFCRVYGWSQAVRSLMSRDSERAFICLAADIHERVQAWKGPHWNETVYNPFVEWSSKFVADLIETMASNKHASVGTNWYLRSSISSCLMHRAIEMAFLPKGNKSTYAELCELILLGHMPCGWRGRWPKGKIVVY